MVSDALRGSLWGIAVARPCLLFLHWRGGFTVSSASRFVWAGYLRATFSSFTFDTSARLITRFWQMASNAFWETYGALRRSGLAFCFSNTPPTELSVRYARDFPALGRGRPRLRLFSIGAIFLWMCVRRTGRVLKFAKRRLRYG